MRQVSQIADACQLLILKRNLHTFYTLQIDLLARKIARLDAIDDLPPRPLHAFAL